MKQLGRVGRGAAPSAWQLEEAQVFWAKNEQGLALGILQQMIETLSGQVSVPSAAEDDGFAAMRAAAAFRLRSAVSVRQIRFLRC